MLTKLRVCYAGFYIAPDKRKRLFNKQWRAVRIFSGPADLTGTKAGRKGRFGIFVKFDIFTFRLSCPAYRNTKYARSFDANKKHASIF
ncbi:hypothetical protein N037_06440 [Enterobacter sp. EGD-HP1]|nr:hypothetical protein N037_06440 [Enterobacter sp. EGD-HP1]